MLIVPVPTFADLIDTFIATNNESIRQQ